MKFISNTTNTHVLSVLKLFLFLSIFKMASMIIPPDLLRKLRGEPESENDYEKARIPKEVPLPIDNMTVVLPESNQNNLKEWEVPNSWEDIEIETEANSTEEHKVVEELPVLIINLTKLQTLKVYRYQ